MEGGGSDTASGSGSGNNGSGNNGSGNNGSQSFDIEAIITNAIARYVRDNLPQRGPRGNQGPPGDPGKPGPLGQDDTASARNNSQRFIIGEVNFFNPFYDNKSVDIVLEIEHINKDTYFYNVTMFINRIKNVTRSKVELLRNNL